MAEPLPSDDSLDLLPLPPPTPPLVLPRNQVIHGDSRVVLRTFPSNSVDSVVTDPPAGIAFMAKDWDNPWEYGVAEHGFTDGGERVPAPLIGSSGRNPTCRTCKRHKRGWKDTPGCECEAPDYDETDRRLLARDAFIAFLQEILVECFRVLKPGGHMLVWSIPRTSHWTATAIENAGFEMRDCIFDIREHSAEMQTFLGSLSPEQVELLARAAPTDGLILHIFGQGFPKSLNVAKAIAKTPGTSEENAAEWEGWGTSLKPAVEGWWLCRKPIEAQNVARQILKTRTGAINIDGCRVFTNWQEADRPDSWKKSGHTANPGAEKIAAPPGQGIECHPKGRWPSHLVFSHSPACKKLGKKKAKATSIHGEATATRRSGVHAEAGGHQTIGRVQPVRGYADADGTEEVAHYKCEAGCPVRVLDEQSGELKSGVGSIRQKPHETTSMAGSLGGPRGVEEVCYGDSGGASRFFQTFKPEVDVPFIYTGKATKKDKDADLEGRPAKAQHGIEEATSSTQSNRRCMKCQRMKFGQPYCQCEEPEFVESQGSLSKNFHPTVKSQALMTYLVRLVTPKGGIVLDPFAGSGSTLVGAITEEMSWVGIEREAEYHALAVERTSKAQERADDLAQQRSTFEWMMSQGD